MHVHLWVLVVSVTLVGAAAYGVGRGVERRRRSRAEHESLVASRSRAVMDHIARQERGTSLLERVRAERVADVLADVAARTDTATPAREREPRPPAEGR